MVVDTTYVSVFNHYVSEDTGFQIVYGESVISVKAATASMKKQWMTRISQASSILSAAKRS
jgi:hypothetical protein